MADPIVFISTFAIRDGRASDFERMFAAAVELIGSTKPRTALYAGYIDADGSTVRVVHAFADATAIATHFEGSDERSSSADEVIVPLGFALYGSAPEAVVDQLRREAAAAGVLFEHLPVSLGGFIRSASG
jgi:hypothetical protein